MIGLYCDFTDKSLSEYKCKHTIHFNENHYIILEISCIIHTLNYQEKAGANSG